MSVAFGAVSPKCGSRELVGRATLARWVQLALLAVLGVFLYLQLAPVQLGGRASYVVTDGVSMLPTFTADGLVVTRVEDGYNVGDVVAYHNRQLGEVVMHRIVARDGSTFVFKGDNNDFRDGYHPANADLVGKEWVYWPGAGRYLKFLRNPLTFAVIVGGMALVGMRSPRRSRRRSRHHAR
jgi:signal peptidase I